MSNTNIRNTIRVIDYIESHLEQKSDLETIADALHYSKYYLHRIFTETVGMTMHDYIRRRQLTEAAKLLVFSDRPVLEIALLSGYGKYRLPGHQPDRGAGNYAGSRKVLFQNLIITAGKPGFGMVLSVSAGVANVVLDYVFMGICKMGIRGSALGTGIGYLIPTIFSIFFFMKNSGTLRFCRPSFDWKMLVESLGNGSSEMVSQMASAVTTFLFNSKMMELAGEDGVAAITIMIYTQFFLTTLYIGFSMGIAPVVSYNYGRKDHGQLKRTLGHGVTFMIGISVCVFTISMLLGVPFLKIFCPPESEVFAIAKHGIRIFPFAFLCGMNIFASAMFTALSNGKISALISFLRTFGWITVLLAILPEFFGITGVWMAVPIAEGATWVITGVAVYKYRRVY